MYEEVEKPTRGCGPLDRSGACFYGPGRSLTVCGPPPRAGSCAVSAHSLHADLRPMFQISFFNFHSVCVLVPDIRNGSYIPDVITAESQGEQLNCTLCQIVHFPLMEHCSCSGGCLVTMLCNDCMDLGTRYSWGRVDANNAVAGHFCWGWRRKRLSSRSCGNSLSPSHESITHFLHSLPLSTS